MFMRKALSAAGCAVVAAACVVPAHAEIVAPPTNTTAPALWKHASTAIVYMPGLAIQAQTCDKIEHNVFAVAKFHKGSNFAALKKALEGPAYSKYVNDAVTKVLRQDNNPAHSGPDFQAILAAAEDYYAALIGQKANSCGFVSPKADKQVDEWVASANAFGLKQAGTPHSTPKPQPTPKPAPAPQPKPKEHEADHGGSGSPLSSFFSFSS